MSKAYDNIKKKIDGGRKAELFILKQDFIASISFQLKNIFKKMTCT